MFAFYDQLRYTHTHTHTHTLSLSLAQKNEPSKFLIFIEQKNKHCKMNLKNFTVRNEHRKHLMIHIISMEFDFPSIFSKKKFSLAYSLAQSAEAVEYTDCPSAEG